MQKHYIIHIYWHQQVDDATCTLFESYTSYASARARFIKIMRAPCVEGPCPPAFLRIAYTATNSPILSTLDDDTIDDGLEHSLWYHIHTEYDDDFYVSLETVYADTPWYDQ